MSGVKSNPTLTKNNATSLTGALAALVISNPKSGVTVPTQPGQRPPKSHEDVKTKTFALFKCGSDECGNKWKSAHGWESLLPPDHCKCKCGRKGEEMKSVEMCALDHYRCTCGESWNQLHDAGSTLNVDCPVCHIKTKREGTQSRFATHYSYRCKEKACACEWENFDVGRVFTQRCRKCGSGGQLQGIRQETKKEQAARIAGKGKFFGKSKGSHNVDGCDMCQALIGKNVARDCTTHRRVLVSNDYGVSYDLRVIK